MRSYIVSPLMHNGILYFFITHFLKLRASKTTNQPLCEFKPFVSVQSQTFLPASPIHLPRHIHPIHLPLLPPHSRLTMQRSKVPSILKLFHIFFFPHPLHFVLLSPKRVEKVEKTTGTEDIEIAGDIFSTSLSPLDKKKAHKVLRNKTLDR